MGYDFTLSKRRSILCRVGEIKERNESFQRKIRKPIRRFRSIRWSDSQVWSDWISSIPRFSLCRITNDGWPLESKSGGKCDSVWSSQRIICWKHELCDDRIDFIRRSLLKSIHSREETRLSILCRKSDSSKETYALKRCRTSVIKLKQLTKFLSIIWSNKTRRYAIRVIWSKWQDSWKQLRFIRKLTRNGSW